MSMAMTLAPSALAIMMADSPTPPQPCTATHSPARTLPWSTTARNEVTNRQPREAAVDVETHSWVGGCDCFIFNDHRWIDRISAKHLGDIAPAVTVAQVVAQAHFPVPFGQQIGPMSRAVQPAVNRLLRRHVTTKRVFSTGIAQITKDGCPVYWPTAKGILMATIWLWPILY